MENFTFYAGWHKADIWTLSNIIKKDTWGNETGQVMMQL